MTNTNPHHITTNRNILGVLSIILLSLIFASMGIFSRLLSDDLQLFEQVYLRIAFAFFFLAFFARKHIRWAHLLRAPAQEKFLLLIRGISLYLAVLIFTEALLHANYGLASVLTALPFLPVFGFFFFKERLSLRICAWILFGLLGSLLIALKSISSLHFGYGESLALLAMLLFDASYIARRWQSEYLNNWESTLGILGVGAIFLFVTGLFHGEHLPHFQNLTQHGMLFMFILALLNIATVYLTNYGFQHVKLGIAGNLLTLETVFAMLYAVFLYQEIPTAKEFLGCGCILLSVFAVQWCEEREKAAAPSLVS